MSTKQQRREDNSTSGQRSKGHRNQTTPDTETASDEERNVSEEDDDIENDDDQDTLEYKIKPRHDRRSKSLRKFKENPWQDD